MKEETLKQLGFIEAYESLFGTDEFNIKSRVTEDAEEYSDWQEFDEENERKIQTYKQKFIEFFNSENREDERIVKRIENVPDSNFTTTCIKCGKELEMYFNGGELDVEYCCGYKYTTTHERIDLIITKEQ